MAKYILSNPSRYHRPRYVSARHARRNPDLTNPRTEEDLLSLVNATKGSVFKTKYGNWYRVPQGPYVGIYLAYIVQREAVQEEEMNISYHPIFSNPSNTMLYLIDQKNDDYKKIRPQIKLLTTFVRKNIELLPSLDEANDFFVIQSLIWESWEHIIQKIPFQARISQHAKKLEQDQPPGLLGGPGAGGPGLGYDALGQPVERALFPYISYFDTPRFKLYLKLGGDPSLETKLKRKLPRVSEAFAQFEFPANSWLLLSAPVVKRVRDNLVSPIESFAEYLYCLTQQAGMTTKQLLELLEAEPRRLLSLYEAGRFMCNDAQQRVVFAAELLKSFSLTKALKRVFPKIPHFDDFLKEMFQGTPFSYGAPFDLSIWHTNFAHPTSALADPTVVLGYPTIDGQRRPVKIGDLFTGWDEWKNQANAEMDKRVGRFRPVGLGVRETLQDWIRAAKDLSAHALNWKDILFLIRNGRSSLVRETFNAIPGVRGILAETPRGRQLLQHYTNGNWREVMAEHDFIFEAVALSKRPVSDADAYQHHSQARQFICPPGVYPLVEKEAFKRVGEMMKHCVGGYFYNTKSFVFQFIGARGCKATLELTLEGHIEQYRSFGNSMPDEECKKLLAEFLMLNASRIEQMKQQAKRSSSR